MSASSIDVHIKLIQSRLENAKESFRLENKKEKSSLCHRSVWLDLSNALSNAPLAPLRAQTIIVKVVYFLKGPGTRCEKNGACSRISTRKFVWTAFFANKFSFRDWTFVRLIQWLSWFRTVVRLVLSVQLDLPAFFPIEIWTSVICSVDQRLDFGEWYAGWLFEPGAAVDGNWFSSNWQWTWFCVCGLE